MLEVQPTGQPGHKSGQNVLEVEKFM